MAQGGTAVGTGLNTKKNLDKKITREIRKYCKISFKPAPNKFSELAAHDAIVSLSGALNSIGRKDSNPIPTLNLIGDYGGGGMHLAFGIVSGLIHALKTGEGQVVDSAMVDGSLSLMSFFYSSCTQRT